VAKIGKNGRCPDCEFIGQECQACTDRIIDWSSSGGDQERKRAKRVLVRRKREYSLREVQQLLTYGEIG